MQIKNIHEAIRLGEYGYEPLEAEDSTFDPTGAMPGTNEKLSVLVARAEAGLPLWNGNDRSDYDEDDPQPATIRRPRSSPSANS